MLSDINMKEMKKILSLNFINGRHHASYNLDAIEKFLDKGYEYYYYTSLNDLRERRFLNKLIKNKLKLIEIKYKKWQYKNRSLKSLYTHIYNTFKLYKCLKFCKKNNFPFVHIFYLDQMMIPLFILNKIKPLLFKNLKLTSTLHWYPNFNIKYSILKSLLRYKLKKLIVHGEYIQQKLVSKIENKSNIVSIEYPHEDGKTISRKECFKKYILQLKLLLKKIINIFCVLIITLIIKYKEIDIVHSNYSVTNVCYRCKNSKKSACLAFREFGKEDYRLEYEYDLGISKATKFMEKYSDKVIVISYAFLKKYSKYITKDKIIRIYNGINIKKIIKLKGKKESDKINLILIGLLYPNKGQKEAILAIEELCKRGYNNFVLNLVKAENYKSYLKDLVKSKDLNPNVKFWDYVKNPSEIISKSDIALTCSKN